MAVLASLELGPAWRQPYSAYVFIWHTGPSLSCPTAAAGRPALHAPQDPASLVSGPDLPCCCADGGEYGQMAIRTTGNSDLYSYTAGDHHVHTETVWMSHGDSAERLPDGFAPVATSEQVETEPALSAAALQLASTSSLPCNQQSALQASPQQGVPAVIDRGLSSRASSCPPVLHRLDLHAAVNHHQCMTCPKFLSSLAFHAGCHSETRQQLHSST